MICLHILTLWWRIERSKGGERKKESECERVDVCVRERRRERKDNVREGKERKLVDVWERKR